MAKEASHSNPHRNLFSAKPGPSYLTEHTDCIPHWQCSQAVQRWPSEVCCQVRMLQNKEAMHGSSTRNDFEVKNLIRQNLTGVRGLFTNKFTPALTAPGPSRGPGFGGSFIGWGVTLHGEAKDLFQLLSIRWWDGETTNGHLYQGKPHAPDIRLHRVVCPLQTLRLETEKGRENVSEAAGRQLTVQVNQNVIRHTTTHTSR